MDLRRDYRLPEQVETQNYDEKEVIKENMIRLFNGDNSGFLFFDKYFNLPDGKSLSSAKDISQIFSFILKSFCQSNLPELSYKALAIIYYLTKITEDHPLTNIDVSFFLCDEFIQYSISLFSNPNKQFALLSLKTLKNIIKSKESYLLRSIEFGYLNRLPEILNFPDMNLYDQNIEKKCLNTVAKSIIPISKMNIVQYNPLIFQISYDFIMSNYSEMNLSGLEILTNLINHNFSCEVDEALFKRFFYFAEFASEFVLYDLFKLLSSKYFPNYDDHDKFSDLLAENNFYLKLINRIETDSKLTPIILGFLDVMYSPTVDDPIINKLMQILETGKSILFKNKIEAIRYLCSLVYDLPDGFSIFLSNNGIFLILSELIDNEVEIIDVIIKMSFKIINSIIASGADLESFSGSIDLYESFQNSLGKYGSCYDEQIEDIIQKFPCE